jgi:histone deacetylase complex regulatory component SIN3
MAIEYRDEVDTLLAHESLADADLFVAHIQSYALSIVNEAHDTSIATMRLTCTPYLPRRVLCGRDVCQSPSRLISRNYLWRRAARWGTDRAICTDVD